MNVVLITQARLGSSRLPRKVLKPILGRPMIAYHLERVRRSELVNSVCVATTTETADDELVRVIERSGLSVFRGSETDVLSRFTGAAELFNADVVVRVTSDCPLLDPHIIDQAIALLLDNFPELDYVSNTVMRTFPRGQDVEVMTAQSLYTAAAEAVTSTDREHVTPFIWRQPERFRQTQLTTEPNNSHLRWTVDVAEDFELVTRIIEGIYPHNPHFAYSDILDFVTANPELNLLNAAVDQKAV